jgi:hypothetical protein
MNYLTFYLFVNKLLSLSLSLSLSHTHTHGGGGSRSSSGQHCTDSYGSLSLSLGVSGLTKGGVELERRGEREGSRQGGHVVWACCVGMLSHLLRSRFLRLRMHRCYYTQTVDMRPTAAIPPPSLARSASNVYPTSTLRLPPTRGARQALMACARLTHPRCLATHWPRLHRASAGAGGLSPRQIPEVEETRRNVQELERRFNLDTRTAIQSPPVIGGHPL